MKFMERIEKLDGIELKLQGYCERCYIMSEPDESYEEELHQKEIKLLKLPI